MAIGAVAGLVLTAPEIVLGRPLDVIADEQVEIAILVVVEPSRAGGPVTLVRHSRLGCYIREGAVAVVVVEDGVAVTGHQHVGVTIVVEIPHGYALAVKALRADAGLFRDVGESTIAIVVIEGRTQRSGGLVPLRGGRLDKVKVHQPVLVVIDPAQTVAHGLDVFFFRAHRGVVLKGDSGGLADIGEAHWNSGRGRRRRLRVASTPHHHRAHPDGAGQ